MLKNILKLDGAQQLSKNDQKSISGGRSVVPPGLVCCEWVTRCGETFCSRMEEICEIVVEL